MKEALYRAASLGAKLHGEAEENALDALFYQNQGLIESSVEEEERRQRKNEVFDHLKLVLSPDYDFKNWLDMQIRKAKEIHSQLEPGMIVAYDGAIFLKVPFGWPLLQHHTVYLYDNYIAEIISASGGLQISTIKSLKARALPYDTKILVPGYYKNKKIDYLDTKSIFQNVLNQEGKNWIYHPLKHNCQTFASEISFGRSLFTQFVQSGITFNKIETCPGKNPMDCATLYNKSNEQCYGPLHRESWRPGFNLFSRPKLCYDANQNATPLDVNRVALNGP